MTGNTKSRMPQTPEEWTAYIAEIQSSAFLIGPLQEIRHIPEGFDVTATRIVVDVEGETYWVGRSKQGEERGLGKSAIERLATAAGASARVTRTDDRSHPRRCEYTAVAQMRLLDGSSHYAEASRAYDMTEEGTDWISIFEAAASKAYEKAMEANSDAPRAQEAARFAGRSAAMAALGAMHRNAETKGRLRSLRTLMGIRAKYLAEDLRRKHFMVLRLSATGRSSNPALQAEFSRMLFANAIGASAALFGPAAGAPSRALAYQQPEPSRQALPAPAEQDEQDHDGQDEHQVVDSTTGEVTTEAPATEPPREPEPERKRAAAPTGNEIPKGLPGAGKTFATATVEELAAYIAHAQAEYGARGKSMSPTEEENRRNKIDRACAELDSRKALDGAPF